MNENKLTIKDSSISFVSSFILCQLGAVFASIFTTIIYRFINPDTTELSSFFNSSVGYLISALALYIVMICVFLFFNKHKQNKIFNKVKSNKLLIYIAIAILSFLFLYPIVTCVDSLLYKLGINLSTLPYELTTKNYFISLISLVIAPAICEELLFRGIIFRGLQKHGKVVSITISALMFSLFHMSLSQTLYPILMGILLGVIMYYENNIYYCIAVHLTNNFLSLTLSYFKINLIFNHWTYILLAIILLAIFLSIVLTFTIKNRKIQEKQPISKNNLIFLLGSLTIMILFWILVNFI